MASKFANYLRELMEAQEYTFSEEEKDRFHRLISDEHTTYDESEQIKDSLMKAIESNAYTSEHYMMAVYVFGCAVIWLDSPFSLLGETV